MHCLSFLWVAKKGVEVVAVGPHPAVIKGQQLGVGTALWEMLARCEHLSILQFSCSQVFGTRGGQHFARWAAGPFGDRSSHWSRLSASNLRDIRVFAGDAV